VHAEIMVPFIDHSSQSSNSAVYRRECAARQAAENASGFT
jgi:hypothetical protein